MLLIELATQAVKGFSPSSRLAFKPGYNVVVPPQGAAAGLSSLLSALFYYDGRGGDAALAAAPGARVGLTVQGRDGRVYRLMRQLGGAGALHRLEANNTWAPLTQDSGEINQYMRTALGLPAKGPFEELFCFRLASLPSQQPVVKAPAPAVQPQGGAPAAAPASGERRLGQPNRLVEMALAGAAAGRAQTGPEHVAKLKQEIEVGKQLEELQFKQDGLQQQLFALTDRMKQLGKIVDAAEEIRKKMASAPSPEALGIDARARATIPAYDGAVKKLREEIGKIAREKEDNRSRLARTKPLPVWKDQQFLIAAGAGVALLALAAALNFAGGSPASYVGLLGIPAFGFAGLCTLRWIGELQAVESLGRKDNLFKDREQKLQEEFERDYGLIKSVLAQLDLDDGPELLKLLQQQDEWGARLREAEARRKEANADVELAQASEEHARLTSESQDLESTIGDLGAGRTRDFREAERELLDLERLGTGAAHALGAEGAGAFEDPVPKLLAIGRELFAGATVEALGAAVRERAAQYLVALSDRRFQGLDIDATGQARLLASDKMVPAAALDRRDADLLYLAVKLTLLEKYAPGGKPVLVLDEPFAGLEGPKLDLLCRMLKHISGQTQIVHLTGNPAPRAHAVSTVAG